MHRRRVILQLPVVRALTQLRGMRRGACDAQILCRRPARAGGCTTMVQIRYRSTT
jgi:hypothetical protein